MLYRVELKHPYSGNFGGKIRFKIPSEINEIKSISIGIDDMREFEIQMSYTHTTLQFDLFKFSLILNNGNDEAIIDAPFQGSLFRKLYIGNIPTSTYTRENSYQNQKFILNKRIIKNSVHYAIFKMTEDLLAFRNSGPTPPLQFVDNYLRSDNFNLVMYIEAK